MKNLIKKWTEELKTYRWPTGTFKGIPYSPLLGKCKLKPQWDITSHLLEWPLSKMQEITRTGKDAEKRELSYTVDGNVNWCSHYGRQYEDTSKIINRTIIWSSYPTLGIYSNNTKTLIWNGICTSMFTAVLFTKSKIQKQCKCPSMNEWIQNMWGVCGSENRMMITRGDAGTGWGWYR